MSYLKLRWLTFLTSVLWVSIQFSPAHALSLKLTTFLELRQSATAGVWVRVQNIVYEPNHDPLFHGVQTRLHLVLQQTLFGSLSLSNTESEFDLITLGGQLGDTQVVVPGVPLFNAGEELFLFVNKHDDGDFTLVGHGMGVYRITRRAENDWIKPDIAVSNGPLATGESVSDFALRLGYHGEAFATSLPSPERNVKKAITPNNVFKMAMGLGMAFLLLLAIYLRRKRFQDKIKGDKCHRIASIALMAAPVFGIGFFCVNHCEADAFDIPAQSRSFELSGAKWNLYQTLRGRTSGGRVLWVRGLGTPDIPDDTAFGIIAQKFQQWEDIPGSAIAFKQDGISLEAGDGFDERNTISFLQKVSRKAFDVRTLAITFIISINGTMLDTDIVFNNEDTTWVPTGAEYSLDVVALHEIGHLVGLNHTAETPDVMFSFAKGNVIFSSGDIDGASQLYPVTPPSAPFPFISASSGTGPAPLNVLFSSKQSASRIGETLTAEWDFGDGSPTSTELEPLHTYTAVGQYTATLIVQDSFGSATTTKIIIVGDSSKPLTVTKFKFKTLLLVPLNLIRGRDVLQMTLENTDLQIGDVFFLSVNRVNLTSESGGTLDSHLQFKIPKGVDGTLSLKLNAKKNHLTVSLTGATLGLGFDPRISSDTSRNGVASFPIVLRIQRGNQQIVQTSEATFSYEVKSGSTPNGFFEKSIAGIKN